MTQKRFGFKQPYSKAIDSTEANHARLAIEAAVVNKIAPEAKSQRQIAMPINQSNSKKADNSQSESKAAVTQGSQIKQTKPVSGSPALAGYIANGFRTCGTIISAVIESNSEDLLDDISEILSLTQSLIEIVKGDLEDKGIDTNPFTLAAVNHLCVETAAANWRHEQEVRDEWSKPIVTMVTASNMTQELSLLDEPENDDGQTILALAQVSSKILIATKEIFHEEDAAKVLTRYVTAIAKEVERVMRVISNFSRSLDEEERRKLTLQLYVLSADILKSIIKDEHRSLTRHAIQARKGKVSTESLTMDIDYTIRRYRQSMKDIFKTITDTLKDMEKEKSL